MEMSPAQEVPGAGKIRAPRQPWGGWGRPWGHLGTGTFLGSPGDGDIPEVTWGGGRILPLLQGKSHSLGHFLKKTPTRESVVAPKKPTQDKDDPKISPPVPVRPGWGLGTSRGVPPGRGAPVGVGVGDLCILCMKINLFSQYLYPAAMLRFPQLCQRWVMGFGVSPNGVVSPKGVVSLNGVVSP